jgi:hypothetical protein
LPEEANIYCRPSDGAVRQGEVISALREIWLSTQSDFTETNPRIEFRQHPFAVVLSQDCDLDQDFRTRQNAAGEHESSSSNLLSSIMFCEAVMADELRGSGSDMDSKTWKRVRFNKDERYHYLSRVPPLADLQGQGFSELALDFKKYFTVPTHVVYWQLRAQAKRRCCLLTPYAEHLSGRFFFYQARIALPVDHHRAAEAAPGGPN